MCCFKVLLILVALMASIPNTTTMALDTDAPGAGSYFPAPYSLDPLPNQFRNGLIAPGVAGLLSAASTLVLLVFIMYRLISWRKHYHTFIGYNQYVMLVLNLLLADFMQAMAFVISWHWISKDYIRAPTPACFAQGWLLHSGDLSSGFFVLAIAFHTFLTAVPGWRIPNRVFYVWIIFIWLIAYVLTFAGVILHRNRYFVRAGAWCWVNQDYEDDRLALHYVWVFFVEFATITLYAITFFALRRKTKRIFRAHRETPGLPNPKTIKAVNRITKLMMLYPLVYVLCTLPLSSGRMWTMAHNGASTSNAFACTAGALLGSCGWVDALLYTLTRKRLLSATMPGSSGSGSGSGRGGPAGNNPGEAPLSDGIITTRTVTVMDSAPEPGEEEAYRVYMRAHGMAQPELRGTHTAEIHAAYGPPDRDVRPASATDSTAPILGGDSDGNAKTTEPQYTMKEMLDANRAEESKDLELGKVDRGRRGVVPSGW